MAQLGERRVRNAEAEGSNPFGSTIMEKTGICSLFFSCCKPRRRGSKPQGSAGGGTVRWTVEPTLVRDLREAGRRRKGRGSGPVDPFGVSLHPEILHIAVVS